jgi:hypothetical protein
MRRARVLLLKLLALAACALPGVQGQSGARLQSVMRAPLRSWTHAPAC